MSTLLATIPTQIIAFVFLPLQAASQTYSEKDPRSPSIVARIGLKENPRHPTETPIHDHQAPCTGATVFQDSKSFTIEDRFKFIADSVIDRLPVTTVDFAKQRVWCDPFKPVTDLKTGLHPHVIHRVGHHSYESAVTPSLRVHIYGSLTPNQRMDYSFVKRAFSTEDIPEKREEFLFGHTSFFRGMAAHEAAF